MKKILAFSIAFSLIACCYAEEIPNYKGFPIYPSEKAIEYQGKDLKEIKIALFTRDYLDSMHCDSSNSCIKTLQQVTDKIDKAREYIEQKASRLGWELDGQDQYKDGGSLIYYFLRKNNRAEKVSVTFWSGGIMWPHPHHPDKGMPKSGSTDYYHKIMDGAGPYFPNDFGIIEYKFY